MFGGIGLEHHDLEVGADGEGLLEIHSKSFDMFKGNGLKFRVEAFNVLNKTNFRAPSGNRSTGAFGTTGCEPGSPRFGAFLGKTWSRAG